jgi:hypothetical protein
MLTSAKRSRLAWEYGRVQQDLNALLNPPKSVKRPLRYWATVQNLHEKLQQIEQQLLQAG